VLARVSFSHSKLISTMAYICFRFERKWQIRLVAEHYRLEDFTEDTVEFVRQLNAPAVLVGHSIGGVIALMAAARCPEKVKALIIEDPL